MHAHGRNGSPGDFVPQSTFYANPFGRMFAKSAAWTPCGDTDGERTRAVREFVDRHMPDDVAGMPRDNPNIPAGYTYFGQFIDHDLTFDPTSSLQRANDPNRLHNFRTPRLDLDSVYGRGPHDQPYLYDTGRAGFPGFFLIGSGDNANEPDLPRNSLGRALIGDMRNDENTIVSQLHLAVLKFHNAVLERIVGAASGASEEQFNEAQRIVRWFYQYVVWNDFIHRLVDPMVRAEVLARNHGPFELRSKFYRWEKAPYIPVEFSVAAYRLGHSMVRPGYQVNATAHHGFGVERPIFLPPGSLAFDLRGFRRLPTHTTLEWDWFLKFPSSRAPFPQLSRKIDRHLSAALRHIPMDGGTTEALGFLNLMRGWRMGLPSGPTVARLMGLDPIARPAPCSPDNALWIYILDEAEAQTSGTRLGSVGSRIVAEVFAGILHGDPLSYVNQDPAWQPTRERRALPFPQPVNGRDWELADLVRAAGVPITAADVTKTVDGAHEPA